MSSLDMSAQNWINLQTGGISKEKVSTIPTRDIEKTDDGYCVTYTFNTAFIQYDQLLPGTIFWQIDGFGLNETPGEAGFLFRNDMFVVPSRTTPVIEVVDSAYIDFRYELTPARQPLLDNDDIGYTKDNVKPITPYKGFLPSSLTCIQGISEYRGQGLCYATVHPIQYNYKEKTVRAYKSITYRVRFEPSGECVATGNMPCISISDKFLNNIAIGSEPATYMQSYLQNEPAQYDVQDYLIISTPEFEDAVNTFAEWKRMLGFNVHINLRNNWTPDSIKAVVNTLYNTEGSTLNYLLIIGDHDDVPAETKNNDRTHVTDYYYGQTNSQGVQSIKVGRLPVSNQTEAITVVNKIIRYEKAPPAQTSFYHKGVSCSYFQDKENSSERTHKDGIEDRNFIRTSEAIRDYVMAQGKEIQRIYYTQSDTYPTHWKDSIAIPTELKKPNFAWDGNASKILQAINNGCFYILHRGHGQIRAWNEPWIEKYQLRRWLHNGNLLPVVFSINCRSGMFNNIELFNSDDDCFAEAFLKMSDGGCVAIYAAAEDSYSNYNDALSCGMFDAIWPEPGLCPTFTCLRTPSSQTPTPTYRLGQILQQGLARMTETTAISAETIAKNTYTREIYHCLGDPSMQIYTEQPTEFENVEISYTADGIHVGLSAGEIANISFYNKNTGNSACYIGNNINFATSNPYEFTICISAHNKIPLIREGTIYIQNETITGEHSYNAGQILVGSDVTTLRPRGNTVFNDGHIRLNANRIILDKGTSIERNTVLETTNN